MFEKLMPLLNFCSFFYFFLFALWFAFTAHFRKEQSFPVQKVLSLVPLLKMLESVLTNAEFKACPWESADVAEDAYLKMGKVTIVTFAYTFIHALLFLLCQGWNTTNYVIDRNKATNLTLVMGAMYLLYSAYFLSADVVGLKTFVDSFLTLTYFFLGFANYKGCSNQAELMKQILAQNNEDLGGNFRDAIRLKMAIMQHMRAFVVLFFLQRTMLYYYESLNSDNEFMQVRLNTVVLVCECMSYAYFLWNFRPRKQWPDFFTVGLGDLAAEA